MADRYVVIGLARSRCRWFGELARWATTAVAPIEFIKCLTADEARAVIGAGRPVSALLIDAGLPRLDRDLIDVAQGAGAPTILVGSDSGRDWEALGCATALGDDFSRDQLVDALDHWARRVARSAERTSRRVDLHGPAPAGRLVGVTGPGGTGTSTVAMAVAQDLAQQGSDTVLVDGCRCADLAMYHDIGDVIPGLPELVELHRADDADPEQIRSLEFDVTARGYRLLLGMRRSRDWAGMRPRAVGAAIDGLRRTHGAVVVDHDPDVEREDDTGSADIEDRHAIALATTAQADAVVVVVASGVKGLHDAARIIDDLCRIGVRSDAIVSVVTQAPRSPATRAQTARALRELTVERNSDGARLPTPVFIPAQRSLESCHRTASRLPASLTTVVGGAVAAALGRVPTDGVAIGPERIRPGDLGTRLELATDLRPAGRATSGIRGDVA